jgi:hypothetical protein
MYKYNVDSDGWPTHAWGDEFPPLPVFSNFPFYRIDLQQWYVWDASTGAWSEMGGAGFTVEEADGAPSATDIDTLQFNQAHGFAVTDVGGGVAQVGVKDSLQSFAKGGVWTSPTAGDDAVVWKAPFPCTVTNVRGFREGGTGAAVNASKNGVATEHLAADLSLTSADTWMDGGAVQNTAYADGDYLVLRLISVAGAPDRIILQVDFTRA